MEQQLKQIQLTAELKERLPQWQIELLEQYNKRAKERLGDEAR